MCNNIFLQCLAQTTYLQQKILQCLTQTTYLQQKFFAMFNTNYLFATKNFAMFNTNYLFATTKQNFNISCCGNTERHTCKDVPAP
jgi:hypothetical protein